MRTSTVLVGLSFAVLVAAVLAAPLFLVLPSAFLPDDWYVVQGPISALGYLGAVLVIGAAGAAAAWFDRDDSVRAATAAGGLSALLGGAIVAAPATAVQAAGDLLTSEFWRMREVQAFPLLLDALVNGTWLPITVGMVMALVGPALGAMGGVTLDMYLGVGARRAVRLVQRSTVPMWGLAALAIAMVAQSAYAAQIEVVMWPNLAPAAPDTRQTLLLAAPVLAGGGASAFLLGWAMRDVALLWRSKLKFFALLWALIALGSAGLGTLGAVLVHERLLTSAVPWGIGLACAVATVTGLAAGGRQTVAFDSHPRTGWQFFGQGVLIGVVVTICAQYVAVAPVSGTFRLMFPVYRYFLNGLADPPLQGAADLVRAVYLDHAILAALVLPVAVLYLVLAWPFWMIVRMYSAR